MNNASRELEQHIARLHSNGRLRVWSLIITFFGDAVALRGGRVALSALQEAMGLLHVEPGAVRTALSRLARESWVEREREGRLSFYKLTTEGRATFDEPTKRIYAAATDRWNGEWTVAVDAGDNSALLSDLGFVPLGGSAWLKVGAITGTPADDMLIVSGTGSNLPPGLLRLWKIDEQATHYSAFVASWQGLGPVQNLSPGEAMAARTLLIHDWRRIVLRDPVLPDALLPADWIGFKARGLAGKIYHALLQGSEKWLNDNGLPALSEPEAIYRRFIVLQNIAIQ